MALEIIGSGFGRTGTLSLKAALETLGHPCYHMEEVLARRDHITAWQRVAHGEAVDWDELFAGFTATVDFPASVVYRDLLDHWPDAKVIHTVRDPQRWYESTDATIYRAVEMFPPWAQRHVGRIAEFVDMQERLIWQQLFDGRFGERDHAIEVFEARTREVRAVVPAEQLLVFEVAEGWEPLCAFLGVAVPDEPFPNVNDKQSMQRALRRHRRTLHALPWVGGATVGVAAALAARWRRRSSRTIGS